MQEILSDIVTMQVGLRLLANLVRFLNEVVNVMTMLLLNFHLIPFPL